MSGEDTTDVKLACLFWTKKDAVTDARAAATSTAPYRQPTPAPTPQQRVVWTAGGLTIEISLELPPLDEQLNGPFFRAAALRMCDLFVKSTLGPRLVEDIAKLPGTMVIDPAQPVDPKIIAGMPRVQRISVKLLTDFVTGGVGDDGEFRPQKPSQSYEIEVRLKRDNTDPLQPWPPILGLRPDWYITFGHRSAGARMAVTLYHELLHVWFVNCYWFYFLQGGNTGHGAYNAIGSYDPTKFFFDEVVLNGASVYPFRERLRAFYGKIDGLDGVKSPATLPPTPSPTP